MPASTNYLRELLKTLGPSPSYEDLVNALVPELVDLAEIFVRRGTVLELVAYRHIDPDQEAVLAELARIHRPSIDHPTDPVAATVRSGEPRLRTWVSREHIERATSDTRVHAVFDAIQPRNVVVVPLEREGDRFGAIVAAMSSTSRRFMEGDLEFMVELARQIGPLLP